MSVANSSFSCVGGRALSSLLKLIFSLRFQNKQWQIFLPTTTCVKITENNEKFRRIKTKIWKNICVSSVIPLYTVLPSVHLYLALPQIGLKKLT